MKLTTSPLKTLFEMAKTSNNPVTFVHRDKERTSEVILPNGESILCVSVRTLPRNRSMIVTLDSIRHPATLMEVKTDVAHCWFVWLENALHGQFSTEQEALQFIAN